LGSNDRQIGSHSGLEVASWAVEPADSGQIAGDPAVNGCNQAVAVEKLHFSQNSQNLRDRKCLGKLRKSFVGHPDAILFLRISRERVFQQPQAIALKTPAAA
jgi:hypothetical protein